MTDGARVESTHTSQAGLNERRRWLALIVLCLGVLMIMLDTTIVNVVLPSMREDLKFTQSSLVWVVNAYMLTFGCSLLLGGRLADFYGHRRLFLIGIMGFTVASLACGLASTRWALIVARALQGFGGSVVLAVALALIMGMFTDRAERAKAVGVYSFVSASGGSAGLLLGGIITSALNWHWIFLVNVPVGVLVCALGLLLLPSTGAQGAGGRLDVWGALTLMISLTLAIEAIVDVGQFGWTSARTLGLLVCAAILFVLFIIIEVRISTPLLPLRIFKLRNLAIANVVSTLWAAGSGTGYFTATLYMQLVLGYGSLQVGLAFLPANLIAAAFALGLSAKLVRHLGIKMPLGIGLTLITIGLALLALAPLGGGILVSMILIGLGAGAAYNPMLLAAMSDVAPSELGLASGIVNSACMMGSALGLAILASFSAARANGLLASGATAAVALASGYQLGFVLAAASVGTAALLAAAFLRTRQSAPASAHGELARVVPATAED